MEVRCRHTRRCNPVCCSVITWVVPPAVSGSSHKGRWKVRQANATRHRCLHAVLTARKVHREGGCRGLLRLGMKHDFHPKEHHPKQHHPKDHGSSIDTCSCSCMDATRSEFAARWATTCQKYDAIVSPMHMQLTTCWSVVGSSMHAVMTGCVHSSEHQLVELELTHDGAWQWSLGGRCEVTCTSHMVYQRMRSTPDVLVDSIIHTSTHAYIHSYIHTACRGVAGVQRNHAHRPSA